MFWLGSLCLSAGCSGPNHQNATDGADPSGVRAGRGPHPPIPVRSEPALPTSRIAIVGASVSAGLGGTPFGDLFAAAAPRSKVEAYANVWLFRDPVGDTHAQIDRAIGFHAESIFAIDLLFWDVYGSTDDRWRERSLAAALGELERARQTGAWIVVGDVPRITTAAEMLIPKDHVPDVKTIAHFNHEIAQWSHRDRVVLVPFASWAEPLANGDDIEIAPGERVPAKSLVGPDGLHANELGAWAILDRLDHFVEAKLPGTPPGALVFVRPKPVD